MKQYDIEEGIICCLLVKPELLNELYVSDECFLKSQNKRWLLFFKNFYKEYKTLDLTLMLGSLQTEPEKEALLNYYCEIIDLEPSVSVFYEYQDQLVTKYKNTRIMAEISKFSIGRITNDELIENINKIQNEILIVQHQNKVTPEEMLEMIRNKEKIIIFPRFWNLNEKLKIKKRTVNVIGARPSEGKSALALNLFCDLAKEYKCIYFNMEMTEAEVYERMLGIESDIPIKDVIAPQSAHQDGIVNETARKIYNYKYEIVNGSKNISSIKNKIIKEQREEHLIVFIDYVGYIVGKAGETDKDRIGNAVRELNNITKDYDCTIFLVAQINRNGSDVPTMQDLKDSGELEQTADTIILIHDDNKENNSDVKEIGFLIPKCRGGKRNIRIPVEFNKQKQRMEIK